MREVLQRINAREQASPYPRSSGQKSLGSTQSSWPAPEYVASPAASPAKGSKQSASHVACSATSNDAGNEEPYLALLEAQASRASPPTESVLEPSAASCASATSSELKA